MLLRRWRTLLAVQALRSLVPTKPTDVAKHNVWPGEGEAASDERAHEEEQKKQAVVGRLVVRGLGRREKD